MTEVAMPDSVGKPITKRSTGDLLILIVASTICFSVLASGALIAALKLFRPEADIASSESQLSDVINTLIGLLAGFLAGKTQQAQDVQKATSAAAEEVHAQYQTKAQLDQAKSKPATVFVPKSYDEWVAEQRAEFERTIGRPPDET